MGGRRANFFRGPFWITENLSSWSRCPNHACAPPPIDAAPSSCLSRPPPPLRQLPCGSENASTPGCHRRKISKRGCAAPPTPTCLRARPAPAPTDSQPACMTETDDGYRHQTWYASHTAANHAHTCQKRLELALKHLLQQLARRHCCTMSADELLH